MTNEFEELFRQLGYRFSQLELLQQALTHRSVSINNNERLEFLGDSILNFVIAEKLWQQFPDATEGELSRLRAHLVKGEALGAIAQELGLNHVLRLGHGEMKAGGQHRTSIVADALEAVIAAIYLDAGIDVCRERILAWYKSRLTDFTLDEDHKDPKTRLQELLQGRKLSLPQYTIIKTEGDDHNQTFHIECRVTGLTIASVGIGTSRRRAEQIAAKKFLQQIQHED